MPFVPAPVVQSITAYAVPKAPAPTDLALDGNEGARPDASLYDTLTDVEALRRYPNAKPLEAKLAARHGLSPEQVVVCCGADEALDRCCRAALCPGREAILPRPIFPLTRHFSILAGATLIEPPWEGEPFPTEAVLAAITPNTALIGITSPNNPTGGVISAESLCAISAAAPDAMIVVDLAYVEFADEDLTAVALSLPNAVVLRTLSKAWGLAGARVGYAAGPAALIRLLRATGLVYPVSGPSLALAERWLDEGEPHLRRFVAQVREDRARVTEALRAAGVTTLSSQANFVCAKLPDPIWARDAFAGLGIAVRALPKPGGGGYLRVTTPGDAATTDRLVCSINAVFRPEALLFDLDGVLADVSGSYRAAIFATAASYGVTLTPKALVAAKEAGDANNDWVLTQRLLAAAGVEAPLPEVTARFEALYQGDETTPGLRLTETLRCEVAALTALAARMPLAIVTGRPRRDAERFLAEQGVLGLFKTLVCMEDAPLKPDPAPVRLALARLGVKAAWMFGDTPDDVRAARSAGVLPLGVCAPQDPFERAQHALTAAGAARVFATPLAFLELLP